MPNDAASGGHTEEAKVNDQGNRTARLRYTAIGALAALAAAGAIAGTAALANGTASKTATPPAQGKTPAPQQGSSQPFLNDVQRLVDDGTISSAQGQALDREILAGRIDTQTLASSGFTATQLQAVQQALSNTKRALAGAQPRTTKDRSARAAGGPGKSGPPPDVSARFLAAVQRLVNDGTISKTQGETVDRAVLAGRIDTQTLAASGFSQAQVQAVQQALSNVKRAIARQMAAGAGG